MGKLVKILENSYFDSVSLMSLAARIKKETGSKEVVVLMATDMNKDLIRRVGLGTEETDNCTQNDCMIGVDCDGDAETIVSDIVKELQSGNKTDKGKKEVTYRLQEELYKDYDSNIVVISVPGRYAAHEAKIALDNGKNVMLFSDNVSEEDELKLKKEAVEKGLLLMGPDCGTTILNGVGLCFANEVRRGDIGIVGASGTGLQEVTVLIDKLGGGISQAIGVGGRDLHKNIGGLMTLQALDALAEDQATKVCVVVSKPPEETVAEKVVERAKTIAKPVVLCFIDGNKEGSEGNIWYVSELAKAAEKACELCGIEVSGELSQKIDLPDCLAEKVESFAEGQKYLRGLYCGGTLCSETLSMAKKELKDVHSNLSKKEEERLADPLVSEGNTIIDMGDDFFTNGRPHPMIEPSVRLDRIVQEAKDPSVAVLLMDFELGYGSHDDPVGITLDAIDEAVAVANKEGRRLVVIAYVLGTDKDKQSLSESVEQLRKHGVYVTNTNAEAARMAIEIVRRIG